MMESTLVILACKSSYVVGKIRRQEGVSTAPLVFPAKAVVNGPTEARFSHLEYRFGGDAISQSTLFATGGFSPWKCDEETCRPRQCLRGLERPADSWWVPRILVISRPGEWRSASSLLGRCKWQQSKHLLMLCKVCIKSPWGQWKRQAGLLWGRSVLLLAHFKPADLTYLLPQMAAAEKEKPGASRGAL